MTLAPIEAVPVVAEAVATVVYIADAADAAVACAADAADADVAKFSPSIVICCCVANAAAPTATFADTAAAIPTGTATNKTTAPKQPATIAAPFKNCFLSLE